MLASKGPLTLPPLRNLPTKKGPAKDFSATGVFLGEMKTLRLASAILAIGSLTLGLDRSFGQAPAFGVARAPLPYGAQPPEQPTFDIDFPGGTPKQLLDAVQKAAKIPINAIIPDSVRVPADFTIPPLKLRNVTVPQLFEALNKVAVKTELRRSGQSISTATTTFGFRSQDQWPGTNSIWYFFVDAPPEPLPAIPPPTQCRFWQLAPYLEKLKVEDITTAIESGWKMLGVNPLPKLNFHKDTQLLIVVGQQGQLAIVDDVLRELTPGPKPPKIPQFRSAPAAPSE